MKGPVKFPIFPDGVNQYTQVASAGPVDRQAIAYILT